MAGGIAWSEAVLFDLHYVFYSQFPSLWDRTEPCPSPISWSSRHQLGMFSVHMNRCMSLTGTRTKHSRGRNGFGRMRCQARFCHSRAIDHRAPALRNAGIAGRDRNVASCQAVRRALDTTPPRNFRLPLRNPRSLKHLRRRKNKRNFGISPALLNATNDSCTCSSRPELLANIQVRISRSRFSREEGTFKCWKRY